MQSQVKAREHPNAPHNQGFSKPKKSKPHPWQNRLDARIKGYKATIANPKINPLSVHCPGSYKH